MTHGTQGKSAPTPPTFLPAFVSVLGNHSPPAQQEPRLVQGFVISRTAALLLSTWAQIVFQEPGVLTSRDELLQRTRKAPLGSDSSCPGPRRP